MKELMGWESPDSSDLFKTGLITTGMWSLVKKHAGGCGPELVYSIEETVHHGGKQLGFLDLANKSNLKCYVEYTYTKITLFTETQI